MLHFAANLTMLYNEVPFLDRFAAAARDGFIGVECLFPYEFAPADLASRLREHGLQQVLFNAPPGDWSCGERGIACLFDRQDEFRASIQRALNFASVLECPRVHVMAGIPTPGTSYESSLAVYMENLRWAAEQAATLSREILIEPINPVDMPGYFLNRQEEAHRIVAEIAAPNLKVQMDLYHCARVEGDLASVLGIWLNSSHLGCVGHLQIAGVPTRNEPSLGTLDYAPLFQIIEKSGYDGWIGCEYRPAGSTSAGLGWLRDLFSASAACWAVSLACGTANTLIHFVIGTSR